MMRKISKEATKEMSTLNISHNQRKQHYSLSSPVNCFFLLLPLLLASSFPVFGEPEAAYRVGGKRRAAEKERKVYLSLFGTTGSGIDLGLILWNSFTFKQIYICLAIKHRHIPMTVMR